MPAVVFQVVSQQASRCSYIVGSGGMVLEFTDLQAGVLLAMGAPPVLQPICIVCVEPHLIHDHLANLLI